MMGDAYWAGVAVELSKQEWDNEENLRRAWNSEPFKHPSNPDGSTLCDKIGRPHLMKRFNHYDTLCIHDGCDGCI